MELSNGVGGYGAGTGASGEVSEATSYIPDESDQGLLDELKKDFERLQQQKARPTGGVEGSTLTNLCFLNDEQYVSYTNKSLGLEGRDENKLYLTFNLIAPRYNKVMGRLSAFNAPFKARPNRKDPDALDLAEASDRMIIALDEKCDEPSRLREIIHWLLVGGVAHVHTPWVPNATIEPTPQFTESGELLFINKQQPDLGPVPESVKIQMVEAGLPEETFEIHEQVEVVGDVGCEVFGPFNVFIDQSVRSIQDLSPDQWVHLAQIRTTGWVKENFEMEVEPSKEISLVVSRIRAEGEASGGTYLKDLLPLIQGSADDNDPPMVVVVQSYQPSSASRPHGRYVCWVPDQKILHDEDNPYDEIPLVDIHWTPVTTSYWTKAYITPLIAPQRFINKRMSQLGEQANAGIYSPVLLGGGLKASDYPADYPGAIEGGLSETGAPNVGRVPPPDIPNWFLQSIEMAVKMFNDAAGSADLMEDNQFPGQLRGPLAVPMLQEILDTQWGPLFNHLGERLARIKQQRLNRVKQFYPPIRTMHYTDRTQKDEVLTFHTDKVLRSGTNFSITVERGALLPELRALRESRVTERLRGPLAILYMDERTGRLDKSKIAQDLAFGDTGRETREGQYRKFGGEIIKLLWEGQAVPPVQPFYDHKVMLDELEASMATTEFLRSSPAIQQGFLTRWEQHSFFLQQEALAQQQMMMSQAAHSAVAQSTQQAAAMAAADAVHEANNQVQAQKGQPTGAYTAQANAQAQKQTPPTPPRPTSRKTTITREEKG
jgi:hypothetical protein